jgi:hypothetical protein
VGTPIHEKRIEITYKGVDDLYRFENNPRDNELAIPKVAESIARFGWKVPLVIKPDGEIVAGHTRWEAAKLLEVSELPCIIDADLTDDELDAYRLLDNRLNEIATYKQDILQQEVERLKHTDLLSIGWNSVQLEEIANGLSEWASDISAMAKVEEKDTQLQSKVTILCEERVREDIIRVVTEALDGYDNVSVS